MDCEWLNVGLAAGSPECSEASDMLNCVATRRWKTNP
jgi:hypothetical protein